MNYIDRFLEVERIARADFQLLGVTCLWLAAKYDEVYLPSAMDLAEMTAHTYTPAQLCAMEIKVRSRFAE